MQKFTANFFLAKHLCGQDLEAIGLPQEEQNKLHLLTIYETVNLHLPRFQSFHGIVCRMSASSNTSYLIGQKKPSSTIVDIAVQYLITQLQGQILQRANQFPCKGSRFSAFSVRCGVRREYIVLCRDVYMSGVGWSGVSECIE